MEPTRLWIPGIMPVQFLILLAVLFFVGIAVQRVLTAKGRRITMFWQVLLAWIGCFVLLTMVVYPPLPFHLLANYLGAITVALFLYAGATESGWQECRDTVLGMLRGRTRTHRIARVAVFVALPVVIYSGLHDQMIPEFPVPMEFRSYFAPMPRVFTVQGETYFSQFSEPTWVGREEAHPSPAQRAAAVTFHIPPHLVELAGGYSRVQVVESGIDLGGVLGRVESAFPALQKSDLRKTPGASSSSVNFFVVDRDGHFVGTDRYAVAGRSTCCTARIWTATPPGSHVYVLPKGYEFTPGSGEAAAWQRGGPAQPST